MSTITVSDLKRKATQEWRDAAQVEDLVITDQGQPVALLLPVDAQTLESTLSTLRSLRALQAQSALQKTARHNSTDKLTMDDIDAEIAASRRAE